MKGQEKIQVTEEKRAPSISGMLVLLLFGFLYIGAIIYMIIAFNDNKEILGGILAGYLALIGWIPFMGLRVLRPNEAYVLTLFGQYYGTLVGPGFYCVNPFVTAINPGTRGGTTTGDTGGSAEEANFWGVKVPVSHKAQTHRRMSLKTMTLSNATQKINDKLGNPIIIGIVVIWRVENTAKAAFNVDNYAEYLSIQCDSALRNIVRLYPYDTTDDAEQGEKSLRGSSVEIAQNLRDEIQTKVEHAGLEILEARITSLAYAPEIAAAMLQRQQASAIIDARQMIVEGAVGMVESALQKLSEHQIVELDDERKAAMVSNLLVVLCGNKDAQPIVNSGSIY